MNLKRILIERNISQEEFGQMIGKTRTAVNQFCSGRLVPNMETLMKMCEVLDVQPGELLDDKSIIRVEIDKKLNGMTEAELARVLGMLYEKIQ